MNPRNSNFVFVICREVVASIVLAKRMGMSRSGFYRYISNYEILCPRTAYAPLKRLSERQSQIVQAFLRIIFEIEHQCDCCQNKSGSWNLSPGEDLITIIPRFQYFYSLVKPNVELTIIAKQIYLEHIYKQDNRSGIIENAKGDAWESLPVVAPSRHILPEHWVDVLTILTIHLHHHLKFEF